VYPGGHVAIFSVLHAVTGRGENVLLAQGIFAVLLALTVWLCVLLWKAVHGPSLRLAQWLPALLFCASRRIHSLFVLRLFNDCFENALALLAVLLFARRHWVWGCLVFSCAVSVKMNGLLYAPGLLYLLIEYNSLPRVALCLSLCAAVQLVAGAPFLLHDPVSYVSKAFEFSREFFFVWTVNWRFLGEEIFLSKKFGLLLLAGHLAVLALFLRRTYAASWRKQMVDGKKKKTGKGKDDDATSAPAAHIVQVLFASNFIGIAFSRTIHYQFYTWYFFTLPFLLWGNR
jgi:alpha-1,3-mannosyltransferase